MAPYSTKLRAGLALITETKQLLELWEPGMGMRQLYERAHEAGIPAGASSTRLYNLVREGFAPRYLAEGGHPAMVMKCLAPALQPAEFSALAFIYTCRGNPMLGDFIREVYWPRYEAGAATMTKDIAKEFVVKALGEGRMARQWGDSMIGGASRDLVGACGDFGLIESGRKTVRRIMPFRLPVRVGVVLAYDLHLRGLGDSAVAGHEDWGLFGLSELDVLDELKRLATRGDFIVQTAGDLVRVGWKHSEWEAVLNAIVQG